MSRDRARSQYAAISASETARVWWTRCCDLAGVEDKGLATILTLVGNRPQLDLRAWTLAEDVRYETKGEIDSVLLRRSLEVSMVAMFRRLLQ